MKGEGKGKGKSKGKVDPQPPCIQCNAEDHNWRDCPFLQKHRKKPKEGKGKGRDKPGKGAYPVLPADPNKVTKKQLVQLFAQYQQNGWFAQSPPPKQKNGKSQEQSGTGTPAAEKNKTWKTKLCNYVAAGKPWECPAGGKDCRFHHNPKKFDEQGNLLKTSTGMANLVTAPKGWEDPLAAPSVWEAPPGLQDQFAAALLQESKSDVCR